MSGHPPEPSAELGAAKPGPAPCAVPAPRPPHCGGSLRGVEATGLHEHRGGCGHQCTPMLGMLGSSYPRGGSTGAGATVTHSLSGRRLSPAPPRALWLRWASSSPGSLVLATCGRVRGDIGTRRWLGRAHRHSVAGCSSQLPSPLSRSPQTPSWGRRHCAAGHGDVLPHPLHSPESGAGAAGVPEPLSWPWGTHAVPWPPGPVLQLAVGLCSTSPPSCLLPFATCLPRLSFLRIPRY
ncbi:uncharacterized protein ACIB01_002460 isoform 1-T1 [Guaruba guarouba]